MLTSWENPPSDLSLPKQDLHIWRADLDLADSSVRELKGTLSPDERRRADRFHFERDKKRFIAGVGILRTILGRYLSVEPEELQFSYGEHGKPRLSDAFGNKIIHFNMSHSEGLALYGFSQGHEIGVDIECVRDIPEMEQIVEESFSVSERGVFGTLPRSKKREAFFNCWTRKEAFMKAIGGGLFMPLDKFAVSILPGEPAKLLRIEGDEKEASRWSIWDLRPARGFVGAFAVEGGSSKLHFWQWPDQSTTILALR